MGDEASLAGVYEKLGELAASAKERAQQNTELFTLNRATLNALSTLSSDVRLHIEELRRHMADDSEMHLQLWQMLTRHHETINGVTDDPENSIRGRLESLERSRSATRWLARATLAIVLATPAFLAATYGLWKDLWK